MLRSRHVGLGLRVVEEDRLVAEADEAFQRHRHDFFAGLSWPDRERQPGLALTSSSGWNSKVWPGTGMTREKGRAGGLTFWKISTLTFCFASSAGGKGSAGGAA